MKIVTDNIGVFVVKGGVSVECIRVRDRDDIWVGLHSLCDGLG